MSSFAFVLFFLATGAVVLVLSQQPTKTTPGIIAGVCGGVVCSSDSDCPYNQKCQRSPCGGYLCTNVGFPPPLRYNDVTTPPPPPCALVDCNEGRICRLVTVCNSCPLETRCIPVGEIYDGIDNECRQQSYAGVILVENPSNSSAYIQQTCAARYQICPSESECVGGICCNEKLSTPLRKPGLCPTTPPRSACRNQLCHNDYDCPLEKKCCPFCGNVCADPIFVLNDDQCGNTRCPSGEVCVYRTPFCPPGMACIQVLLPVCVPCQCSNCAANEYCRSTAAGYVCAKSDNCGGCPNGKVCKPTGPTCLTNSCSRSSYACVPIDRCGGCPQGQECRRNTCRICPSYKCYPIIH